MRRHRALAAAKVAAITLAFSVGLYINVRLWFDVGRGVDFNQFYSASKLAGTGRLYDWGSLTALEAQHGPLMPTGRLPVEMYSLKPLTWLSYTRARWIWLTASMAALLAACLVWPGVNRWLLLLAFAWSASATYTIALGQDTAFWMLFFGLGLALLERGRTGMAGVMFALCICKYHLALPIPVLLIAQRRWNTLITGAVTAAALVAACFVIEGPGWLGEYLRMAARPDFSPGAEQMPNLNGMTSWFAGAPWLEVGAALVCLLLLWFVSRCAPLRTFAGAATVACGLLVGHHAYIADCVLLAPLAVAVLQSSAFPLWLRGWAVYVVTPMLMFAVVSVRPYVGQTAVVGFVLSVMGISYWSALSSATLVIPPPGKLTSRSTFLSKTASQRTQTRA